MLGIKPETCEFDFLEGEWDAVCGFPRPDGSWGEGSGTLKATKILDGCGQRILSRLTWSHIDESIDSERCL